MKNLEQLRAKNAIHVMIGKGAEDGDSIAKKVPAMIRQNGFIGAMAFAKENKGVGYADVFNAIIHHLAEINMLPGKKTDFDGFFLDLCAAESQTLRAVTAESMAYLNYLRRFA